MKRNTGSFAGAFWNMTAMIWNKVLRRAAELRLEIFRDCGLKLPDWKGGVPPSRRTRSITVCNSDSFPRSGPLTITFGYFRQTTICSAGWATRCFSFFPIPSFVRWARFSSPTDSRNSAVKSRTACLWFFCVLWWFPGRSPWFLRISSGRNWGSQILLCPSFCRASAGAPITRSCSSRICAEFPMKLRRRRR